MTVDEFNALVEACYEGAFESLGALTGVYERAFNRASRHAVAQFQAQTVTAAAFVPPPVDSMTSGMTDAEKQQADDARNRAAETVEKILASLGLVAIGAAFMQALAERGQGNFSKELTLVVRRTVEKGLAEGWSADRTAKELQAALSGLSETTAEMLAQTELTTLVNERSLQAATAAFQESARPVYKTWLTMKDPRVRPAHAATEGQTVPISQPFDVGGYRMMYPGDPSAPLQLVARCRCRMSYGEALAASAKEVSVMPMDGYWTWVPNTVSGADTTTYPTWIVPGAEPWLAPLTAATVTVTVEDESPAEDAAEPGEEMADGAAWRALLAVEGVPTEDGRMLADGSLTWRELPLSLTAMDTSQHGAEGEARVAGRIDRIWRDGSEIWGEGVFNTDEFGQHIQELVSNQSLRGNSIEPAVLAYEIWDRDTMEPIPDDQVIDAIFSGVNILTVFTEAVIVCSTVVPTPALGEANIVLAAGRLFSRFYTEFTPTDESLSASAAGLAPLKPPAEWFENPQFQEPTPWTITPEGRALGHVALFDTCHIGEPRGAGVCVTPPRSGMNYSVFHHGAVETAEGREVPCGQITMSTLHAGPRLSWKETQEHYEHSGRVVADVVAGEDRFGIWVSGAVRPDLPAEKVREAKAGALSGDWRDVLGKGLEFISALVVNIPGFPIPRAEARIIASADGGPDQVLALVAAGVVEDCGCEGDMSTREYMRRIAALTK